MELRGIYKLVAFDPDEAYKPRIVEFIKTLKLGERGDFVWAKVIPPFDSSTFSINQDLDYIILGARHFGYSLLEIKKLPIHAYICAPKLKSNFLIDELNPKEITILNWAILIDKNDKRNSLQDIFENDKTIVSYSIINI